MQRADLEKLSPELSRKIVGTFSNDLEKKDLARMEDADLFLACLRVGLKIDTREVAIESLWHKIKKGLEEPIPDTFEEALFSKEERELLQSFRKGGKSRELCEKFAKFVKQRSVISVSDAEIFLRNRGLLARLVFPFLDLFEAYHAPKFGIVFKDRGRRWPSFIIQRRG